MMGWMVKMSAVPFVGGRYCVASRVMELTSTCDRYDKSGCTGLILILGTTLVHVQVKSVLVLNLVFAFCMQVL